VSPFEETHVDQLEGVGASHLIYSFRFCTATLSDFAWSLSNSLSFAEKKPYSQSSFVRSKFSPRLQELSGRPRAVASEGEKKDVINLFCVTIFFLFLIDSPHITEKDVIICIHSLRVVLVGTSPRQQFDCTRS